MSALYSPGVLDHFEHPRNAGDLPGASAMVEVSNPVCGDVLRLAVRVEAGRIVQARFKTRGCVASIACSSWLTEQMVGKTAAELRSLTPEQIATELGGLPPATFHAAELACDAMRAIMAKV
jgi:nitrogen fixation NifU-like protein